MQAAAFVPAKKNETEHLPKNCPMQDASVFGVALPEYFLEENEEFFRTATEISAVGYGHWDRLQSTIQLCKHMGYQKVGLAFCGAVQKEAKAAADAMRATGLNVVSVMCKAGHVDKREVGVMRFKPPEMFEGICNPILQAKLMNEEKTEFNILFGLCVGHDSVFIKYSDAMVTTLQIKDKILLPGVPVKPIPDGYEK